MLRWTPSAVVTSDAGTGIGYTGLRIRGTDPTRINVTINGIPLNDAESQGVFWVDLPDFVSSVNSVQIQRGVGTSTNGAGAFGATINLSTVEASTQAFAELNASVGSFNTLKGNVRFGSGLLKDHFILEGRLSGLRSDGYIDRARADLRAYYLSGTYRGERNILTANLFSGQEETYQAWYGVPPDKIDDPVERKFNPAGMEKPGSPYEDEVDHYRQTHAQLLYNHQFLTGGFASFNLHYTRGAGFYEQYKADQSLTAYGLDPVEVNGKLLDTTDLIRRLWLDNDFFGATFSLNFSGLDRRFDATAGGAVSIYKGDHFGEVIWAEYFGSGEKGHRYYENDARKADLNIYGKINYELLPWLNAFLDLQLRRVHYGFLGLNREGDNVDQEVAHNFFNPKAGLFFTPGVRSEAYLSFAVANREPNRDDYVESTAESRPKPERLYNVEAGYRYSWDKADLGANLYYMHYRDQLVLNGQINDVGAYTRINVDKSYRLGIELTGGVEPAAGLRLDGSATFSRNAIPSFLEYVDVYDSAFNWQGQETIRHRDTRLSFSPAVIAGGQLRYAILRDKERQHLDVALMAKYVGRQYIDNTSDEANSIDPYSFADFRLRYLIRPSFAGEIEWTLLVNNLFNAMYESNAWSYRYIYSGKAALDQGFFPQAGRNFLLGMRLRF